MKFENITPHEAFKRMQEQHAVYIDVRTTPEWAQGHAKGATHIPMHTKGADGLVPIADFLMQVQKQFPDRSAPILLGCAAGGRSSRAATMLCEAGYTKVASIDGGFCGKEGCKGWRDEGLPLE